MAVSPRRAVAPFLRYSHDGQSLDNDKKTLNNSNFGYVGRVVDPVET